MNPGRHLTACHDLLEVLKVWRQATQFSAPRNAGSHILAAGVTTVRDCGEEFIAIAHASARFMLLIASSISCVFLKPTVAQSTPAFRKANLIAFTRSS